MDDNDLLINEPKFTEARHKTSALLKAAKITQAPVKLNAIYQLAIDEFGLVIAPADEAVVGKERDAMLVNKDGHMVIIYNKNRPPARIRFSIAHELGHLYFGHVVGNSSALHGYRNYDEEEANHFAAHLLMPTKMLRNDIKSGLKNVDEIAKLYQVSTDALWIQLTSGGLIKLL